MARGSRSVGAARLRLALPVRFVSIFSTQSCIVLDISRNGDRLALPNPLAKGQAGYLEIGYLTVFGVVVRTERGPDGGINALAFDEPISKAQVLDIRRFAEGFALRERDTLLDQVRRWVWGDT